MTGSKWPARLAPSTPPQRTSDAVVRVSTIDVEPDGASVRVVGRVTDRRHDRVLSSADVELLLADDADRTVLAATAGDHDLADLVGRPSGRGFRRRAAAAAGALAVDPGRRAQVMWLLGDVPIAPILSRAAASPLDRRGDLPEPGPAPTDMCSGFRSGGELVQLTARRGSGRLGTGPAASPPEEVPPPVRAARRRRELVVAPHGAGVQAQLWFRDTVGEPGWSSVVHEYLVTAELDGDGVVRRCRATPAVLPAADCPAAAVTAQRLEGIAVSDVTGVLGATAGVATCPHLDDLLRLIPAAAEIARSFNGTA